jgi:hypothetical protein
MKLLRLLSDLIIKKRNLKRIKKFYEIYCNTIVDSFCVECSNYKEQLNLMPWPQNITLTSGTFTITKQFKVNIKGNPDARLLKGD